MPTSVAILARAVIVAASILGATAGSLAQQTKADTLIAPANLPAVKKLADLTPDFKAFKISVSGEEGGMASILGMVGMLGNGSGFGNGVNLMSLMDAHWTNGDTFQMNGHEYLVTYKPEVGIPAGPNVSPASSPSFALRLVLLRTDMISGIEPIAELKSSDLVSSLSAAHITEDVGIVPVTTNGAIGAAIMFPVFAQAKQAAQHTAGLSNAKQLSLAMIIYTNDYDDVLPYVQSTSSLPKLLYPYSKNDKLWETFNPNGSQFQFNMCLAGVSDLTIEAPGETPMFYETKPWPDGKRVVAFVDGHVKRIGEDEWQKFQPNLHLKLKRSAKKPITMS